MLRAELERRGHEVHGIHFKTPTPAAADVNVFLEVVVVDLLSYARQNWTVPNPEWWFRAVAARRVGRRADEDARRDAHLPRPGRRPLPVSRLAGAGLLRSEPCRARSAFLHVAGKSRAKNTPAVHHGRHAGRRAADGRRAMVISACTDAELRHLLNTHAFCLLPSAYEGYGHQPARGVRLRPGGAHDRCGADERDAAPPSSSARSGRVRIIAACCTR